MKKDIAKNLVSRFQANAYPAMLQYLGEHLGVSAASLERLGIGWCPIVEFKKGPNYQGWWTIPERDAQGGTIGIGMRPLDDNPKPMYPGSKLGLIYAVNPKHKEGEQGYQPGPQNWIRVSEAGVDCPICQRRDGCLLSRENPKDPQACICVRVRENADKLLGQGYLHIRKREGNLNAARPLDDNSLPVVIVEGMSDTCAAMDLGFNAVGRHSSLSTMELLCDLIRGRTAIIVGENDQKSDGRWPGREGMLATFSKVSQVCREVKMVIPPDGVKDLRVWKVNNGLTQPQFLEYVAKHGESVLDNSLLPDERPLTIASAYLNERHRFGRHYTARYWNGEWYEWNRVAYRPVSATEFTQPIYEWGHSKLINRTKANGDAVPEHLIVNEGFLTNLQGAIASRVLVRGSQLPIWISDDGDETPHSDLIVFANGILDLDAYMADRPDYLLEPNPDLFTTSFIPVPFDPTAKCPEWEKFLNSSLGDEPEKIDLLQEWMGYCMTTDTSLQKMMFFRGPPGAGKGTVLDIMGHLVGQDQMASTSFKDLTGQFGLAPLVGKLVCFLPDARVSRGTDTTRGLEVLLSIVGEDRVQINKKFKDQLAGHALYCKVTIASNAFLEVPDDSGAMLRRLLLLKFSRSFVGMEDTNLRKKLRQEIAGIALWSLGGLRRLRSSGFTIPSSMEAERIDWKMDTSSVAAFIGGCCDQAPDYQVGQAELWDCFLKWGKLHGMGQITLTRFFERLKQNGSFIRIEQEDHGKMRTIVHGIRLKSGSAIQFLGRPG